MAVFKDVKNNVGKIGKTKLLYIIALTSVFWFSINILLLIANNETAVESLAQLTFSNDHLESQYMEHVNVAPLGPAHRHDLPWMKHFKKVQALKKPKMGAGHRILYDNTPNVNLNPGLGELGNAAFLTSEKDKKYSEEIFKNHSFNSVLSDKISLDRSLKDVRGSA